MKVTLVTTWKTKCGLAYYSSYLTEALQRFGDIEICRVDPSFSEQEFYDAAEQCNGDLVHIEHEWGVYNGHEAGFLSILRRKNLPIVVTCHGGGFQWFFDKVTQVCVTNQWQRGGHDLPILPHGVTCYDKLPNPQAKDLLGITSSRVVTQWGFILPHKCYEVVLFAIKDCKDVCFLIAGSEERNVEYWKHLQNLIKFHDVKATVLQTGFLKESQIPAVFGATDLCAFPYSTGIDSGCMRYALGSKVVSLATPVPFFQELNTCYGVPYIKPRRLFGATVRRLLMKRDFSEYEAKCERFARENSWENVAKKHFTVYTQVLEDAKR